LKVNFCTREEKKINSSEQANCSPRQARFPGRQKQMICYLHSWHWCLQELVFSITICKTQADSLHYDQPFV
jgi:hypothetical protein